MLQILPVDERKERLADLDREEDEDESADQTPSLPDKTDSLMVLPEIPDESKCNHMMEHKLSFCISCF
jgi:hypothetical protein